MDIQTSRILGILAASFTLLGVISTIFSIIRYFLPSIALSVFTLSISGITGIFSILGFIFFLIAMWGFSDNYKEKKIFKYPLYGFIFLIISFIISGVVFLAFLFSYLPSIMPHDSTPSVIQSQITTLIQTYVPPLVIVFGLIGIVNTILNVLAFNLLGVKSNVSLFRTGAKVLLLGQILSIIVTLIFAFTFSYNSTSLSFSLIIGLPGAIVSYVAWAIFAVAFFRVKVPSQAIEYGQTFA